MNNYERISLMNSKELAKFISDVVFCGNCFLKRRCDKAQLTCKEVIEQWLLSEVTND